MIKDVAKPMKYAVDFRFANSKRGLIQVSFTEAGAPKLFV